MTTICFRLMKARRITRNGSKLAPRSNELYVKHNPGSDQSDCSILSGWGLNLFISYINIIHCSHSYGRLLREKERQDERQVWLCAAFLKQLEQPTRYSFRQTMPIREQYSTSTTSLPTQVVCVCIRVYIEHDLRAICHLRTICTYYCRTGNCKICSKIEQR